MELSARSIFRFALNLGIDLAMIALGWGLDDLPGLLAHPARRLLVGLVAAQAVFVLYLQVGRGRAQRRHMEHVGLLRMQLIAMETIFVVGPYADRRELALLPEPARWVGLALFVLGLGLANWAALRWPARLVAADSLNDFPPDARQQRAGSGEEFLRGPFRWLRYPNLLATLLVALGVALTYRAGPALVFAGLAVVVILLRVREIERIYLARYGSAWAGYSEKTRRLIPFVY